MMNLKTKKLIAALLIATSAGLFTAGCGTDPVSYTHLTLPTNSLV